MSCVDVRPGMLRWACERARLDAEAVARRIPSFPAWERGERRPTLKQLQAFARTTHTPIGFLFLEEPPDERLPAPDFRTAAGRTPTGPSPELRDTLYLCQQRQHWYREWAQTTGEAPAAGLAGSLRLADGVVAAASRIGQAVGFDVEERRQLPSWGEALRRFIRQVDDAGVLVMVSGVVGSNHRRKLDPGEFRGFALADDLAPLIFVNGADAKAAQMFTLAHELAHICLGQSAISDSDARQAPGHEVERWCNRVAAELLVPRAALRREHRAGAEADGELERLARHFKVSRMVVLRRLRDAGALDADGYRAAWDKELERPREPAAKGGGDFYRTQGVRVGRRFARAAIASALEGRSSFSEAMRLLGCRKMATFRKLGKELGVGV